MGIGCEKYAIKLSGGAVSFYVWLNEPIFVRFPRLLLEPD